MSARKVAAWSAIGIMGLAGIAACSGGDDELEQQLAEVTAERDALQAQVDAVAARYDAVVATKSSVEALLADESAYEDPDAMVDELAAFATADAKMDDDVFGAVNYHDAWYYTLFGETQSTMNSIQQWVDPDGSTTGSLWVWKGTNSAGNPFSLIGIAIDSYDDEGMITDEWIAYPYPDSYVLQAVMGSGTPTDELGQPWDE